MNVYSPTGIVYKIVLNKDEDLKIIELKNLISERMAIPSEVFDLIYDGRILNENLKMSDYYLINGSSIHCVENTLGG